MFMEENDNHYSYTCYDLIDDGFKARGCIVGGKKLVEYLNMKKCCLPTYLTVMYDRK